MSEYGKNSFGTGYGNVLLIPTSNPPGIGYGGIGYGEGSYGGTNTSLPNSPISEGFGGHGYGHGPYGSLGNISPPSITEAISLDGFHIEVFFSEDLLEDSDLTSPGNYVLNPIFGAASSNVLEVSPSLRSTYGVSSIILRHSGTTLGGVYEISISNVKDLSGSFIQWNGLNTIQVLCKGEPPPFEVTSLSGTEVLLDFEFGLLEESFFTPGVKSLDSYLFSSSYPILPILENVTHPFDGDTSKVLLTVGGMTTTDYSVIVGPANAIVYSGESLPNEDSSFSALVVGTGTSSLLPEGLSLSAPPLKSYGWSFEDTSGRVLPDSSFRVFFEVDSSKLEVINSIIPGILFTALISDGQIETRIDFSFPGELKVSSGGVSQTFSVNLENLSSFSLVRNQKADTFTFLINGEPIFSDLISSFTGVSGVSPGVRFLVNTEGKYTVSNFLLKNILFTCSQTIFSEAWNFFHEVLEPFEGLLGPSKGYILTSKGPLVKGWGNATPATVEDVSIFINGIPVGVSDVNPYYGKITPDIPIPLLPPGMFTISIDYKWMHSPVFPFAGLNTEGLILNKYDPIPTIPILGDSFPDSDLIFPLSSTPGERFSYGLSLNSVKPRKPLQRSSRFIAFQKQYTSALNSPNTLLLNSNPHIIKKPSNEEETEGFTVFYEGNEDPTLSDPSWFLIGESGTLSTVGDDFGTQGDPPLGTFEVLDVFPSNVSFYSRREEIPFSSSVTTVVRFVVTNDVPRVLNGVFSGVSFGFHTNNFLYLVGCLEINGLQHIGMLVQPSFPELASSWSLGYSISGEVMDSQTFSTSSLPRLAFERFISNDEVRFQVLEGTQAGVYTITEIIPLSDGSFTVSVNPPFPGDPSVYGNTTISPIFEVRWDGDGDVNRPLTYRLVVFTGEDKGRSELFVGGSLSGKALELSGNPPFAIPPDGALLFPTGNDCEFFWGSTSKNATNSSVWNFVRYGSQPKSTLEYFDGISVTMDGAILPEEDPNHIWFVTNDFGSRRIDSQNRVLLRKNSSSLQEGANGLDLTLGYSRIEPFFSPKISNTLVATFQVDSGTLGAGDTSFIIDDGEKVFNLSTISFIENGSRQLHFCESASLCGLFRPEDQGWDLLGTVPTIIQGKRLQVLQEGEAFSWTLESFSSFPDSSSRVFDLSFKSLNGGSGISFGFGVGPLGSQRGVGIRFGNGVELFSLSNSLILNSFPLEWNDGDSHFIRLRADWDLDVLTIIFDDSLIGTEPITNFDFHEDLVSSIFSLEDNSCHFEIQNLSVSVLPPNTVKRTLGVLVGSDVDDINSWKLPRLDGTALPNSDLSTIIQEVDWTSTTKISIHRDPSWGIVLKLPDLGLPPGWTGDFATETLIPSSGWISVEWPVLPLSKGGFGKIFFGSPDSRSISQSRFDFIKYRLYKYPGKDLLAPQFNVLNRSNVITSGEWINDREIESVTVLSTNSREISLLSSNIFAKTVFQVSFVNAAGKMVYFLPESFTFDVESQTITITSTTDLSYQPSQDIPDLVDPGVINPSLNDPSWPFGDPANVFDPDGINPNLNSPPLLPKNISVPVIVDFAAGKPYTKQYICSQPLEYGSTILNEGTPDVTKNLVSSGDSSILLWNSMLNNPWDTLQGEDPLVLNDFGFLGFLDSDPCSVQYENIEFCEVSDGSTGFLSIFCDSTVTPGFPGVDGSSPGDIGNGLIGWELSGLTFFENFPVFSDGPSSGFVNIFIHAGIGELADAVIIPGFNVDLPLLENVWGVVGHLYNVVTKTEETIYFVAF